MPARGELPPTLATAFETEDLAAAGNLFRPRDGTVVHDDVRVRAET